MLVCPLCRGALVRQPPTWRCANNHCYDVAREGYVNLLLVQQKHSPEPGDSAESLTARRTFLEAGHYRPLRDAVVDLLAPLQAGKLLDLGCGEGWYTSAFPAIAAEVVGLDIAKPAIRLAAKRYPGITWIVGSGAALPVDDGSLDAISCLFTQLHTDEMRRALKPGGHVLVVTPAADHLWSMRAGLFEDVIAHEPGKFLAEFAEGYELVERREVRSRFSLDGAGLRALLAMTPYVWKARPERRAALEASDGLTTEGAFALLLFRRRG